MGLKKEQEEESLVTVALVAHSGEEWSSVAKGGGGSDGDWVINGPRDVIDVFNNVGLFS